MAKENTTSIEKLTTEKTEFKREITVFGGVSIIGGIMVGSGIFYLGSYVLMRTGMSQGMALLCWIIGGVVSLLGGLCFAELGASIPKAGGMTVYLNEAYHPLVGFLNGFSSWIIGGPGSIAAIAIALPTALLSFFPLSESAVKIIAVALTVGLTIYNYFGVKIGSILQNISMVAKLIPIAIIMIAALFSGNVSPDLSLAPKVAVENSLGGIGAIAFAVVATLWAYEGWTNLNTVSEEVKNPKKNLPLAIIIAVGGITILYTLFNFSIYRVLTLEQIDTFINTDGNFYLGTEVAKTVLGNAGAVVVTLGMAISMFGALNGCILAFPRMYYAMAEEGHFFSSFKKLHPKYKIPHVALIVQCLISVILILVRSLDQLTNLVIFTGMIYNFLTVLAVPLLRKKYPSIERPYKVWAYPVTVILAAVIFLGLVINTFFDDPVSAFMGLGVVAAGIALYLAFDVINKKRKEKEAQQ